MSSSDPPASDSPLFIKEHRGSPEPSTEPDQGQNLAQLLSRVRGGKQGRFQDQMRLSHWSRSESDFHTSPMVRLSAGLSVLSIHLLVCSFVHPLAAGEVALPVPTPTFGALDPSSFPGHPLPQELGSQSSCREEPSWGPGQPPSSTKGGP